MEDLSATVRVPLSPSPGFCIKSSTLQPAICRVTGETSKLAENTLSIPRGQKVFINFAWDAHVPPPPDTSEEEMQRAIAGEQDVDEDALSAGAGWFVPVIVSEPRSDVDKGKYQPDIRCVKLTTSSDSTAVISSSRKAIGRVRLHL